MLMNCSRCQRMARATPRGVCPDCLRLEDQELPRVWAYIHQHPNQSASEISRQTNVPIEWILRWLREGRLVEARPIPYVPCRRCGRLIQAGDECQACSRAAAPPTACQPDQGVAKSSSRTGQDKGGWRNTRRPG